MLLLKDIIHHLDLVVVPLKDRSFTWSNMQDNFLLEKLDWAFTSSDWSLAFPNTMAHTLAHAVSDHVPCVLQMESAIPITSTLRFKNHWISHPEFMTIVEQLWNQWNNRGSIAHIISGKLKAWSGEMGES
jgi:predicted amino acid racemase